MTFAYDHDGPTICCARALATTVRDLPLAPGSTSPPATGPFPLILFAPGYQQCAAAYGDLLQTWAGATWSQR